MSANVVIHPRMQTQTIVGIGGFPDEAMVDYVLALPHDLILGRRAAARGRLLS